ncbi:MAG: WG repeat-containing protein [Cytophagales bacterium]|nr:WG repeat-containing protein [Cytophagales bacterium]
MRHFSFLFLLLTFGFQAIAQDLLPIRENYFWGFIDTTGNVVIPPRYEQVGQFDEYGYAMVRERQKIGMITKQNKVIVPCQYDNIRSLDSTHIAVLDGEMWGAIDLTTGFKTPLDYKTINVLYNKGSINLYGVRKGLRWGVVREKGEEVIAPVYKDVQYHDSTLWVTNEGDRMGLFGFTGNFLLPEIHDSIYIVRYPHVRCEFKSQGGDALFNIENERQTEYNIQEAHLVKDGSKLIRIRESFNGWNVLKLDTYEPIFKQYYNYIEEYKNFLLLRKANVFGVGDFEGNVIIEPKYSKIAPGPNGGYWVTKKGLLGLVNRRGKEIIAPKYLRIAGFNAHYFLAMTPQKEVRLMKTTGEWVTKRTFKNIVIDEDNVKLYDKEGVLVLELDDTGRIVDQTELKQVATVKLKGEGFRKFRWTSSNFSGKPVVRTQTTSTTAQKEKIKKKERVYEHPFEKVYQGGSVGINLKKDATHSKSVLPAQYWVIKLEDFYYGNVARAILVGGRQCLLVRNGDKIRPLYNFTVEIGGKSKVASISYVGDFAENGYAPINVGGRSKIKEVFKVKSQAEEDGVWRRVIIANRTGNDYGNNQVAGGHWGYIDRDGNMKISPKYNNVYGFLGDRAIVGKVVQSSGRSKKKRFYWGVLSEQNDTIIPIEYGRIEPVRLADDNYLFYVYSYQKRQGIANRYGREISDVAYRGVGKESDGMIPVKQGSHWMYLDTLGNTYKGLPIQTAGPFGEGIAPVRVKNSWGYITPKQDTALKFIYKQAGKFSHGLAPVKVHHLYGYIDKKGEFIIKEKFKKASPFQENGLAIARKKSKTGLIDVKGNWVLSAKYHKVSPFNEYNLAMARKSKRKKKFVLVNGKGKVITKKYEYISPFSDDSLAVVKLKGKYGVINMEGKEILSPNDNHTVFTYKKVKGNDYEVVKKETARFYEIRPFNNGYAAARGYNVNTRSKAWGFIDKNLNWVIEPMYKEVTNFKDGFALAYHLKGKTWYMISAEGLAIRGLGDYHKAIYSNGLVCVKDKYKVVDGVRYRYFYLNEEGKKAFHTEESEPVTFVKAQPFKGGYAVVRTNNGYGLIDVTGTPALSDHYAGIKYEDGYYKVMVSTFVGIRNHNGDEVLDPNYEKVKKITPTILQVRKGGQVGYVFSNGVWLWEPRR